MAHSCSGPRAPHLMIHCHKSCCGDMKSHVLPSCSRRVMVQRAGGSAQTPADPGHTLNIYSGYRDEKGQARRRNRSREMAGRGDEIG